MTHAPYKPVSTGRHVTLGGNTSEIYLQDPKLLGFTLAKYKFVSKMLAGFESVLEIGCGDGFGSALVAEAVGNLICIDSHKPHVADAKRLARSNQVYRNFDFFEFPKVGMDGVFCLDVLEHIPPEDEPRFLEYARASLAKPHGTAIIGMPSLESQAYAGEWNKGQHINCQTESQLKATLQKYFHSVFSFGFNDETLHVGFGPMRHYLMMLCVSPK